MSDNKIKVIIADDHQIVRNGIKSLIELEDDIEVVAMVSGGKDALTALKTHDADVFILDINMPKMNGIEVLKRLDKAEKKIGVIVFTIHDEKAYLVECMSRGVSGYVLKDADSDILIDAIRTVAAGGRYIYPPLKKMLDKNTMKRINNGNESLSELLTDRELDVIRLIASGASNQTIAKNLYISEKTVKNHVSNIFKKIGVTDRTTAAIYAIKNGIKIV